MAIPASQIVQVLPRVMTNTGSDLVFNGLVLDSNATIPTNTPLAFASASDVANYFGVTSQEFSFASVYFGGYANSKKKPSLLYFYRTAPQATNAWIRGTALDPDTALNTIRTITAGTFNVTVNSITYNLANINLTEVNSFSEVAAILNNQLAEEGVEAPVTLTFSSQFNAYTVTTQQTGAGVSLDEISGTVAEVLGLVGSVTTSKAIDACSLTECMNSITGEFTNFVTFTTLTEPSDEEALELSLWASTQANAGTMFLYVLVDSDVGNLDNNNKTIIAERLAEHNNIVATAIVYPDVSKAAFLMGSAASIDWEQTNGTITFAFKTQGGLTVDVSNATQARALESHKVNYVGNWSARNANFTFFYDGSMLGEWRWLDAYLNAVWLCNALQVQLMAMFIANSRIPYTDLGYSIIRANCRDVIERAKQNGVINAGVALSDAQKNDLIAELGGDYSDEIYTQGYHLHVLEASANARQNRISPPCNLVYTYGGAVHHLTLPTLAVV